LTINNRHYKNANWLVSKLINIFKYFLLIAIRCNLSFLKEKEKDFHYYRAIFNQALESFRVFCNPNAKTRMNLNRHQQSLPCHKTLGLIKTIQKTPATIRNFKRL
jgi:hypothetical protein